MSRAVNRTSPFIGLAPFTADDSARFFGRERAARALFELAYGRRFAVLLGRSGAGKSSLLRCRLAPMLSAAGRSVCFVRSDAEVAEQRSGETTLIWDQFEELYIRGDRNDRERARTVLQDVLQNKPNVSVLLSLREDYAAELLDLSGVGSLSSENIFRLGAFTDYAELVQILIATFGAGGIELVEAEASILAQRLLASGECYPPHLQIYGEYAFEGIASGTPAHAFAPPAVVIHERLVAILRAHPDEYRSKLKKILAALVTPSGARRRATEREIVERTDLDRATVESTIRYLEDVHFVVGSSEEGYELTHDYVARSITEQFFSPDDRRLLLAREMVEQGHRDWLRYGVRLGPSRLAAITACPALEVAPAQEMRAYLFVAVVGELRAKRSEPVRIGSSWDEFIGALKQRVNQFELRDLDELDADVHRRFGWIRLLRPPTKTDLDAAYWIQVASQGFNDRHTREMVSDHLQRIGAKEELAAFRFITSYTVSRAAFWSLLAEASVPAWPDLAVAARMLMQAQDEAPESLFAAIDRVLAEWDQAPESASELVQPFAMALSRGELNTRKRAAFIRILAKIRGPIDPVAPRDLSPFAETGKRPVLGTERDADLERFEPLACEGRLVPEILRACEWASRRFKELALTAIVQEGTMPLMEALAAPIIRELLKSSDGELRLMIYTLAGVGHLQQPEERTASLLVESLADESAPIVEVGLSWMAARRIPLDTASIGRLLAGGGASTAAGRSLVIESLPEEWEALEALGPANLWSAMVRWDSDELAAKLPRHLDRLSRCNLPAIDASVSSSPSVRLLAIAVVDHQRRTAGIDWMKLCLGPSCRLAAEARRLLMSALDRELSADEQAVLVERLEGEVSPWFEASVVRFAWTSMAPELRERVRAVVVRRAEKMTAEGSLFESLLSMPA